LGRRTVGGLTSLEKRDRRSHLEETGEGMREREVRRREEQEGTRGEELEQTLEDLDFAFLAKGWVSMKSRPSSKTVR
jgi:hypothetical protein